MEFSSKRKSFRFVFIRTQDGHFDRMEYFHVPLEEIQQRRRCCRPSRQQPSAPSRVLRITLGRFPAGIFRLLPFFPRDGIGSPVRAAAHASLVVSKTRLYGGVGGRCDCSVSRPVFVQSRVRSKDAKPNPARYFRAPHRRP